MASETECPEGPEDYVLNNVFIHVFKKAGTEPSQRAEKIGRRSSDVAGPCRKRPVTRGGPGQNSTALTNIPRRFRKFADLSTRTDRHPDLQTWTHGCRCKCLDVDVTER